MVFERKKYLDRLIAGQGRGRKKIKIFGEGIAETESFATFALGGTSWVTVSVANPPFGIFRPAGPAPLPARIRQGNASVPDFHKSSFGFETSEKAPKLSLCVSSSAGPEKARLTFRTRQPPALREERGMMFPGRTAGRRNGRFLSKQNI